MQASRLGIWQTIMAQQRLYGEFRRQLLATRGRCFIQPTSFHKWVPRQNHKEAGRAEH